MERMSSKVCGAPYSAVYKLNRPWWRANVKLIHFFSCTVISALCLYIEPGGGEEVKDNQIEIPARHGQHTHTLPPEYVPGPSFTFTNRHLNTFTILQTLVGFTGPLFEMCAIYHYNIGMRISSSLVERIFTIAMVLSGRQDIICSVNTRPVPCYGGAIYGDNRKLSQNCTLCMTFCEAINADIVPISTLMHA